MRICFIDKEERSGEEKKSVRGTSMGFFTGISHYMKIYDIVKSAYTNYKVSKSSHLNYYSVFINIYFMLIYLFVLILGFR
jgi:predicted HAD superfamily hydrolase